MSAYSILGLPEGASKEDAKRAYRRLALEYHPDRNSSPDAQRKFIEVTEAYEEIMSGRKRASSFIPYDFYQPVNRNPRYRTAEERQRLREERAREIAKQELEDYLAGVESFRKSKYYPLMIGLFHVIRLFFFAVAGLFLVFPLITGAGSLTVGLITAVFTLPIAYILVMAGQNTFLQFEPYYRDGTGIKNTTEWRLSKNRLARFAYKIPGLDFSHSRGSKFLLLIPALFAFLLIADYFIPHSTTREFVTGVANGDRIWTENFTFLTDDARGLEDTYINIKYTPIFHIVTSYSTEGSPDVYELPRQKLYSSLGIFLPLIIFLCWIGWATGSPNEVAGVTVTTYGYILLVILFLM